MKKFKFKFNKVSIIILAVVLTLGIFGIVKALPPAESPTLGAAESFSVLAQTGITGTVTNITGDVENNSVASQITGLIDAMVTGTIFSSDAGNTGGSPPASTTSLDADVQADVSTAYGLLDAGANADANCIGGILTGPYELGGKTLAPGLYCSDTSFVITGNLTLLGTTGTWVFKAATGLTTAVGSSITGGDPCNVWWRIGTAAAGLGNNSTFIGTIISHTGITFGTGVTLNGRALAEGAAVTLASGATISGPTCGAPSATLTLVKTISGGTRPVADFPLTATAATESTTITGVSGTTDVTDQTVDPDTYTLSETTQSDYTAGAWSCTNDITVNGSSQITLASGNTTTCTITNTYITPVSSSSGGSSVTYGCKDPTATNYNAFSASNPALCVYASITIISTPVIPKLPKTGFPPQEQSNLWNIVIGAGVLMLVSASLVLALRKSKI